MNYNDLLSFRAEYASTAKICDKCTDVIDEGGLCLSKSVKTNSFDAANSPWFHLDCFFAPSKSKSRQRPNTTGQIGYFDLLRPDDQNKIRQKIDAESQKLVKPKTVNNGKANDEEDKKEEIIVPISKLELPVQHILTKIFQPQLRYMALAQYQERNLPKPDFMLNLDNMPWGRLRHEQILESCKVLKDVLDMLDDSNQDKIYTEYELYDLTLRFLELITQNFGSDFPCPLVNNRDPLFKVKLRVLKFFLDSVLGYLLLIEIDQTKNRQQSPAPLDWQYINLQCHVTTLDQNSEMGQIVTNYFTNTTTKAINGYFPGLSTNGVLEIGNIFTIERYDEQKRFEPYQNQTNRKLLWHASQMANFVGILSTGLRMTQARGGCFGRGIYFADAVNKSIAYARATAADQFVLLLLCEVALGHEHPPAEQTVCLPGHSVKYAGSCYPDPLEHVVLPDGILVPSGKLINEKLNDSVSTSRIYNEYIVYHEAQVRLRYLVQLNLKR